MTRAELVERILWMVDGYRFGQWLSVRPAPDDAVVVAGAGYAFSL